MLVDLPDGWDQAPGNPLAQGMKDHGFEYERVGTGLYWMLWSSVIDHLVESDHPFDPMFLKGSFEERMQAIVQQAAENLPHDYGVCDYPEQITEKWPQLLADERRFVILLQKWSNVAPHKPGWLWHKQGKYIGTQNPRHECFDEETDIDTVWTFHIYQLKEQA